MDYTAKEVKTYLQMRVELSYNLHRDGQKYDRTINGIITQARNKTIVFKNFGRNNKNIIKYSDIINIKKV